MDKSEFRIIKQLAEGGQKVVFLAEKIDEPTIKVVIKEAVISSMSSLERIGREINLLCLLDSEYFPKNYGSNFDLTSQNITIIEEYIEGNTLRSAMNSYNEWNVIRPLVLELIEGLSIIWQNNIVHRDLKPENIIIRPDGKPCIIDFGIARFLDMESITNTLQAYGPCTLLYASPEQLRNDKHIIDQRTDFYALGIIILEMYLGEHPFSPNVVGNGLPLFDNIQRGLYALSSSMKSEDKCISALCRRLLQFQPYNRFRNFTMLKQFIDTI